MLTSFNFLFSGNHLQFKDVVDSVKAEVQRIKSKVDILIGVGHYGYGNDINLANAVPELDIIVGGHTHTFLYNMTGNLKVFGSVRNLSNGLNSVSFNCFQVVFNCCCQLKRRIIGGYFFIDSTCTLV